MSDLCAACGLPGHRYGRNEGMERFDPMACINQLRGELETSRTAARRLLEAEEGYWRCFIDGVVQTSQPCPCEPNPRCYPVVLVPAKLLVDPQEGDG